MHKTFLLSNLYTTVLCWRGRLSRLGRMGGMDLAGGGERCVPVSLSCEGNSLHILDWPEDTRSSELQCSDYAQNCLRTTHTHTHKHTQYTHTQAHTHTGIHTHRHTHTGIRTHRHTHTQYTHTGTHTHPGLLALAFICSINAGEGLVKVITCNNVPGRVGWMCGGVAQS